MARKQKRPSKHFVRGTRGVSPKGINHLYKLHVKADDLVEVLSGDDKGKRGKVLRAIPSEGKVVVEGINRKWKHLRRSQENPQGGRIEREYPIPACKVRKVEG
jgi:large subunit ribosomal protein L24